MIDKDVSDFHNKTILVIEDMPPMRELMKAILRKAGFGKVSDAVDGMDGLNKIRNNYFDLIVCDWLMPKMDGLELLQILRSEKEFESILFLMVTNESEKDNVSKVIHAGVDGYIVKPITPAVVTAKIIATLQKQRRFRPGESSGTLSLDDISLHQF